MSAGLVPARCPQGLRPDAAGLAAHAESVPAKARVAVDGMHEREILVILDAADADRVARAVDQRVRVVHRIPPRLLVVRGTQDQADLAAIPGVARVVERGVPAPALDGLSAEERLFVGGWLARSAPKERPGEGLAWDAPGYTPPG